jgi:hypothetical protein
LCLGLAQLRAAEHLGAPAGTAAIEMSRRERREEEEGDDEHRAQPQQQQQQQDPPINPFVGL